jgi:hypothetical protein
LKRNIDYYIDKEDLSDNVRKTLWGAHNMAVIGDQVILRGASYYNISCSRTPRSLETSKIYIKEWYGGNLYKGYKKNGLEQVLTGDI